MCIRGLVKGKAVIIRELKHSMCEDTPQTPHLPGPALGREGDSWGRVLRVDTLVIRDTGNGA